MSIFMPDEQKEHWDDWGFEGPKHPCFLCGLPVGTGMTVLWMGSGGSNAVPPESEDEVLNQIVEVLQRSGPLTMAEFIFFHVICVPSFCRRLLEDFEKALSPEHFMKVYGGPDQKG